MKIAYLIAAHKDPLQLRNLILALTQCESYFFIHIDRKVDIQPFISCIKGIANVLFIKKRVTTNWGGYSQCQYQYNLIEECLCYPHLQFDRIFFLSGLDYPLWSNKRINTFLNDNPKKEFIMGMNLTTCLFPYKMQTRVVNYHYRDWSFRNRVLKRLLYGTVRESLRLLHIRKKNYLIVDNQKIDVYCGSSWWCLTRECLQYVYNTIRKHPEFANYFKSCLAPDELLIQTVVFNSHFKDDAILHNGVYPGLVGLTPLHYIEYEGHIAVYGENDYHKLIKSDKMFCRKVETGVSEKLLDLIDKSRNEEKNI